MKAIVGVDNDGLYKAALSLLGRLKFADLGVELIHTAEPIPPYPDANFVLDPEIEKTFREAAETTLTEAQSFAEGAGLTTIRHEYCVGPVTELLVDTAESEHADLIAIGSHDKSRFGAFFLGSVGRGLTISSRRSVLIAKGNPAPQGPVTAVFATDYTDYPQRALRHFIDLKPAGLARLILVTAVDTETSPDPTVLRIVESEDADRRHFLDEGARTVDQLAGQGITAEAHVMVGDVHRCLEESMRETGADLLVLGAHGHGFFERLIGGSTTLREELSMHCPVLVMRAGEGS